MPAYVTRVASGKLASYDGETIVAMFVDAAGKAAIEAAADGVLDVTYLSELTSFELARTTFTAEVDETLGKIDVASDEFPEADTSGGDDPAGIVLARQTGGSDAARIVIAAHTFTARPGLAADPVAFSNEAGFASWEPAPGTIVRAIGTVTPDVQGVIDSAELATALGAIVGASVGPIFVTAAPSATVDLEDSYDVGRPVVVTVEGTSGGTRPEILWGDPANYVGQVVYHVPAAPLENGASVYGPSVGWHIGATPGVLGDLNAAAAAAAGNDLDFASTPETFEITVDGTPYTATISTDFTGDAPGAFAALGAGLLADGAPLTFPTQYHDIIGDRIIPSAAVTTTTGATSTIAVTDEGTGDRLELLSLTATDGLAAGHEGYNAGPRGTGELNTGYPRTHAWPDLYEGAVKRLIVQAVDDGTRAQWVRLDTSPRSEDLTYTAETAGDWTALPGGLEPAYVGQGLNILAANVGTGGGGSVATDTLWDAAGDLAVGSGANTAVKLTKGTNGHFLKAGASTLSWAGIANTDVSGLGGAAVLNVGTSAGTVAAGDDARFVDAPVSLGAGTTLTSTGSNVLASLLPSTPTVYGSVGDVLHLNAVIRILNNTGSNQTAFDVQVKLGSTTVWDGTGYTLSTSATARYAWLRLIIPVGTSNVTRNAIGSLTFASLTPTQDYGANTADLTSGQALDIVGRTATAAATEEIQCMWVTLVRNRA